MPHEFKMKKHILYFQNWYFELTPKLCMYMQLYGKVI